MPILGYLDDLIIVPAGIALAVKMIPEPVPAVIVGIWLVAAGFVLWLAHDAIS